MMKIPVRIQKNVEKLWESELFDYHVTIHCVLDWYSQPICVISKNLTLGCRLHSKIFEACTTFRYFIPKTCHHGMEGFTDVNYDDDPTNQWSTT